MARFVPLGAERVAFALACAFLALLVLAACVGNEQTTPDEIADQVLPADTIEERAVRLAIVNSLAARLATDRVTRVNAEDASQVLTLLDRLTGSTEAARALSSEDLFANVDLTTAAEILVVAGYQRERRKARDLLGWLVGEGGNASTILDTVGAGFIAEAYLVDAKAIMARIADGSLERDVVFDEALRRIAANRDRVAAMLGLNGQAPPEPPT